MLLCLLCVAPIMQSLAELAILVSTSRSRESQQLGRR